MNIADGFVNDVLFVRVTPDGVFNCIYISCKVTIMAKYYGPTNYVELWFTSSSNTYSKSGYLM